MDPRDSRPYLHSPKDVVPGNKMTFAGLKTDADVQNVIAHLLTFSPDYAPAAPATAPAPAVAPPPAGAPAQPAAPAAQ